MILSCHSSKNPNASNAIPAPNNNREFVLAAQARDAEKRYEQHHKVRDRIFALIQYSGAAEDDMVYFSDVVRLFNTIREQDQDRLYSFDVIEALLVLQEAHPQDQTLIGLLNEAYQPYVDKNLDEFEIEPHLRYRPRDILRREGRAGWRHIWNLYCIDEGYANSLNQLEALAAATGRSEDQKHWNLQRGDTSMVLVCCPAALEPSMDRTGALYDPEYAYEAYKKVVPEAEKEAHHAAQLAGYIKLQRFFLGHYQPSDEDRFGEEVVFYKPDLDRAKVLFAAAGWDESRIKQAIRESGEYWARKSKVENRAKICEWLNKNP